MIWSIIDFFWAGLVSLLMIVGVCAFFYWAGNPDSAHNVTYRKFEQACKDKGGVVAHVRTSALPSTSYSCVNRHYFIEVK